MGLKKYSTGQKLIAVIPIAFILFLILINLSEIKTIIIIFTYALIIAILISILYWLWKSLIVIAYGVEISSLLVLFALPYLNLESVGLYNALNSAISLAIVSFVIHRDAKKRGLSAAHGLWALLGILGVIIYHSAFVRKNPIK